MNLKIVFRENVHKLPDSIQNLNDLMEAFHNLYAIENDFIVKVKNIDDNQELSIQNNDDFQKIVQMFKSHQKGIKFIIYEKDVQLNSFENAVNNILDVTDQKEGLKTFQTLSEPEFEQKQKRNMEIEKQIKDIDLSQQLQKFMKEEDSFQNLTSSGQTFRQLLDEYFQSQLKITGIVDSLKNSEKITNELQQNLIAADKKRMQMQHEIDELKAQIANPYEDKKYSAEVQYNHQLNKVTNTIFNWPLNIKNSGDLHWEDNITISCVQGFQQGFVKQIHPLLPQQSMQIFIAIKCPTEPCLEESIWRLGYLRDNKQVYFGPIIVLQLNVESPQKIEQFRISPRLINLDQLSNTTLQKKALQIQEILQDEDIKKIQKFILKNKFLYSDIHIIIEKYLDQNLKKQQFGFKNRSK